VRGRIDAFLSNGPRVVAVRGLSFPYIAEKASVVRHLGVELADASAASASR